MGNSFGKLFKITTFGESHGVGVGVVIDGCPAGLDISIEEIQLELDRRRPGQSDITTPRSETDRVQILSGIFEGKTLGTPISLYIPNKDQISTDYDQLKDVYRPSHADYSYDQRYGIRDWRGGGRSSNRESAARVAAGAIAKKLIANLASIHTLAWVSQIKDIKAEVDIEKVSFEQVEANKVRCPDAKKALQMEQAIKSALIDGDSLGGLVKFRVKNCPAGLGSPVFDKLTAELAKGLISINATRSFEIGLGLEAITLSGSKHNDQFTINNKKITTASNRSGGVQGGISNGETIFGSVSFKPTATIKKEQKTVNIKKEEITLKAAGRHDPCVLPRAVPIVEAMINLVLADQLLLLASANLERIKKALS